MRLIPGLVPGSSILLSGGQSWVLGSLASGVDVGSRGIKVTGLLVREAVSIPSYLLGLSCPRTGVYRRVGGAGCQH